MHLSSLSASVPLGTGVLMDPKVSIVRRVSSPMQ